MDRALHCGCVLLVHVAEEITLLEDGMLQQSVGSILASIGVTACLAMVFMIVWKERES